nr:MAG TPA: Transglycosylase SLT domain [Caudoviricetes sp.]
MATISKAQARKRANIRFIVSILVILLISAVIGGAITGAIVAQAKNNAAEAQNNTPYGTRDGKALTGEAPYEYLSDSVFTPLECSLPVELQEYTYYLCEAYYIDFDFVMALMYTESSFCTDIISGTNDYGLMQINKCNHAELTDKLGITDFTEPYQNIRAGLYILRRLFEKYDEPTKVCMAYNMGEYGASVLWDKGIYETTYSQKVLTQADRYAAQRGAAADE